MVLDMKLLQEFPANVGISQGSIPGPTIFMMLSIILRCNIYPDTTFCSKCNQASHL